MCDVPILVMVKTANMTKVAREHLKRAHTPIYSKPRCLDEDVGAGDYNRGRWLSFFPEFFSAL